MLFLAAVGSHCDEHDQINDALVSSVGGSVRLLRYLTWRLGRCAVIERSALHPPGRDVCICVCICVSVHCSFAHSVAVGSWDFDTFRFAGLVGGHPLAHIFKAAMDYHNLPSLFRIPVRWHTPGKPCRVVCDSSSVAVSLCCNGFGVAFRLTPTPAMVLRGYSVPVVVQDEHRCHTNACLFLSSVFLMFAC